MKVVFIEDVPNVAEVGDIKEVADGYGRNFLIPRKLAVLPGSQASSIVEARLKAKAVRQAEIEAEMVELGKQLEGKEIILKAKVGAKGRLYGSITSADIVDGLSSSTGLVVDKRKVELEEHIHELGSYDVTIRLTKDVTPKIKLMVVAEEEEEKVEEGEGVVKKKAKAVKEEGAVKKKARAEKREKEDEKQEGGEEEAQ